MIVSDHSPCTADLKRQGSGDFVNAWGGIAALQFSLPVVWTEAKRRGFSLQQVSEWMSAAPAKLARLKEKGAIMTGKDADLIVFQPEFEHIVTHDEILFRNKLTPYEGMSVSGAVTATYVRGQDVLTNGSSGAKLGQLILN
jgi:allantoinase